MTEELGLRSARLDGRKAADLRPISIRVGVNPYAEGSVEVSFGNTRLVVLATVEQEVPAWLENSGRGWITAEYGMLPRATHRRMKREAAAGRQGGRTLEIQRLVGRALRAALNLKEISTLTVRIDCDVLVADGGTRTAAITGGWVALYQALTWACARGVIPKMPELRQVAAVSVGILKGELFLDLNYEEDSSADFDLNIVANGAFELVEIQGTGEKLCISPETLSRMVALGLAGIKQIFTVQRQALRSMEGMS